MFLPADESDTVVAPATARGASLRGVVRLSGPHALALAARAFQPAAALLAAPGGAIVMGAVLVAGERVEASAWVFRAPRSFTGDDVVELHLPGCQPLIDALVDALVAAGARPARPGELSRRAFLAGKLDLAQAEAVQALSVAGSAGSARQALRQLRGGLRDAVGALREELLGALAHLEAALDFAEEGIEHELIAEAAIGARLERALDAIAALLGREAGRGADGALARIVLYGPPNVGKSSLLNALAGREAAIASPIAGTTRDPVEAVVDLGAGVRVEVLDLAGVADDEGLPTAGAPPTASDPAATAAGLDREAEARARGALQSADLVAVILDGATPLDGAGRAALAASAGRPRVIVVQKGDLARRLAPDALAACGVAAEAAVMVSARTGAGLEALRARIDAALAAALDGAAAADAAAAPNLRHRACLTLAGAHVRAAAAGLRSGAPPELAAIDLRAALDAIEAIVGLGSTPDDLLDRVFSTFCIGK